MKESYFCCLALLCLFSAVQADNSQVRESPIKEQSCLGEGLLFSLIRISDRDKIGSLGGEPRVYVGRYRIMLCNSPLSNLAEALNACYAQQGIAFIDLTDYSEPVDIILATQLSDIQSLRRALRIYDLDIIPNKVSRVSVSDSQVRPDESQRLRDTSCI